MKPAPAPVLCGLCAGPLPCRCQAVLERYSVLMAAALVERGARGGEDGWLESAPAEHVDALARHVRLLEEAQRGFLEGHVSGGLVRTIAADVGNCVLLMLDGLGLLEEVVPG